MQKQYRVAFATLKTMGVPVYEHVDDRGNFSIDAECPESDSWVNYWAAGDSMSCGVHLDIEKILTKKGLFAEWVNPGRLAVYTS